MSLEERGERLPLPNRCHQILVAHEQAFMDLEVLVLDTVGLHTKGM
jgi:hypothetical protein